MGLKYIDRMVRDKVSITREKLRDYRASLSSMSSLEKCEYKQLHRILPKSLHPNKILEEYRDLQTFFELMHTEQLNQILIEDRVQY